MYSEKLERSYKNKKKKPNKSKSLVMIIVIQFIQLV